MLAFFHITVFNAVFVVWSAVEWFYWFSWFQITSQKNFGDEAALHKVSFSNCLFAQQISVLTLLHTFVYYAALCSLRCCFLPKLCVGDHFHKLKLHC